MKEREATTWSGLGMLLLLLAILAALVWSLVGAIQTQQVARLVASLVGIVVALFLLAGLYMVEPNQGRVLTLFGAYRGTERRAGLRLA